MAKVYVLSATHCRGQDILECQIPPKALDYNKAFIVYIVGIDVLKEEIKYGVCAWTHVKHIKTYGPISMSRTGHQTWKDSKFFTVDQKTTTKLSTLHVFNGLFHATSTLDNFLTNCSSCYKKICCPVRDEILQIFYDPKPVFQNPAAEILSDNILWNWDQLP